MTLSINIVTTISDAEQRQHAAGTPVREGKRCGVTCLIGGGSYLHALNDIR